MKALLPVPTWPRSPGKKPHFLCSILVKCLLLGTQFHSLSTKHYRYALNPYSRGQRWLWSKMPEVTGCLLERQRDLHTQGSFLPYFWHSLVTHYPHFRSEETEAQNPAFGNRNMRARILSPTPLLLSGKHPQSRPETECRHHQLTCLGAKT
jgi:hypothetical protein